MVLLKQRGPSILSFYHRTENMTMPPSQLQLFHYHGHHLLPGKTPPMKKLSSVFSYRKTIRQQIQVQVALAVQWPAAGAA